MAALLNYSVNTNIHGVNGFGRQMANANGTLIGIYNTEVGEASDTTLTVPSASGMGTENNTNQKILAIISYPYNAGVFVAVQTTGNGVTTAAPDTSGTFTAKPGVINPSALRVNGGDILHFYCLGAAEYISVEFYSIN